MGKRRLAAPFIQAKHLLRMWLMWVLDEYSRASWTLDLPGITILNESDVGLQVDLTGRPQKNSQLP